MPLDVPWSNRMRVSQTCRIRRGGRRIKATSDKFQYGLNLFAGYLKLLDDYRQDGARRQILEHRCDRYSGIAKHPPAALVTEARFGDPPGNTNWMETDGQHGLG